MKPFQLLRKKPANRIPAPEMRGQNRIPARYYGYLHAATGTVLSECLIKDISETGARIVLPKAANLPNRIRLRITGEVTPLPASVIWQAGTKCGLAFDETGGV